MRYKKNMVAKPAPKISDTERCISTALYRFPTALAQRDNTSLRNCFRFGFRLQPVGLTAANVPRFRFCKKTLGIFRPPTTKRIQLTHQDFAPFPKIECEESLKEIQTNKNRPQINSVSYSL